MPYALVNAESIDFRSTMATGRAARFKEAGAVLSVAIDHAEACLTYVAMTPTAAQRNWTVMS